MIYFPAPPNRTYDDVREDEMTYEQFMLWIDGVVAGAEAAGNDSPQMRSIRLNLNKVKIRNERLIADELLRHQQYMSQQMQATTAAQQQAQQLYNYNTANSLSLADYARGVLRLGTTK